MDTATFAAGCFWGVEDEFRDIAGVVATRVGYVGGHTDHPSYRDVCTGDTGHAEAIEVIFNPEQISYEQLLDIFWKSHDPTQLNRQGPDVGSQYRSAIFYHTEEQKRLAQESKERLNRSGRFRSRIVTEIVPSANFWEAEDYHQKYHLKNGGGCGF